MLKKTANYDIRQPIVALNKPTNWKIFEGEQEFSIDKMFIKTASSNTVASLTKDVDLNGYNLTEALKEHPDHLFVKVLAIIQDVPNQNGDCFSAEELKKSAHTFVGVPVFCNHQNDDIEKARGKVVHAWYDEAAGGIWTINRVDKIAYPQLARGIQEGYIVGTSMGCQVHHSYCSICHNKAHTAEEYCDHVKNAKTRKFSGKVKCAFHKSKCKPDEKECPVCGCEKTASSEFNHKEALVFEHNCGLNFIEDSFVVNPACEICNVSCILNQAEVNVLEKKVAYVEKAMQKAASSGKLLKTAGAAEMQFLNKAMKFMESVARSMMDQKDSVSMEYVSDIVDVMANTQTIADELMEMGYGNLPSSTNLVDPEQISDAVSMGNQQGQQVNPNSLNPSATPANNSNGTPAAPQNPIGSVTAPSFMPQANKKIKEFEKVGSNSNKRLLSLMDTINKYQKNKREGNMFKLTRNGITVNAEHTKDNSGVELVAILDDHEVEVEKLAYYRQNGDKFWENPDQAALEIINDIDKVASTFIKQTKESEDTMNKTTTASSVNITTEKQLENAKLEDYAGQRQNSAPDTVTQDQLDSANVKNDTTTDSPQKRKNEDINVTTEGQLESFKNDGLARWNKYPNVITEKQWEEFNRAVGSVLSSDQADHTTDAQLEDLRKNHRWTEPNVTTEGQLANSENWLSKDNAWATKEASTAYAKALISASTEALSDAIALYKRTPSEVVKAAKQISADPQSQIKAAFLLLVNGLPHKVAKRKEELDRASYFEKVASANMEVSPVDALLACMGGKCKNLIAEDFVEAVKNIASSSEKMAKIEKLAQDKLKNTSSSEVSSFVDKSAALEDAFKELFAETKKSNDVTNTEETVVTSSTDEDGLHQVRSSIEEIGVDPTNSNAFTVAAEKFAQATLDRNDSVLYSIEIDEENGTVFTTLKDLNKLTASEKANYQKYVTASRELFRDSLKKEAQMMGGEQPAGPGMGAGAPGGGPSGASLPAPGGAPPVPPTESFDVDPDLEGADEEGGSPKPPGTICPRCGTEDVDIVDGQHKCNNPKCGQEFIVETLVKLTNNVGNKENEDGNLENSESPNDEGPEDKGFDMPENEVPSTPIAASMKITPESLKKFASSEEIGIVSPLTGTKNTYALGKTKAGHQARLCMDTGAIYTVSKRLNLNNPKEIEYRWTWLPRVANRDCSSCNKAKKAWVSALDKQGMTDEQFDALSWKGKGETILAMNQKQLFNVVKTASANTSVLGEFKKAYSLNSGKFPYESCVEKLANRYGQDAIALSGPDKGQNLAECVCNSLKSANIYADKLAYKVASSWKDKDACLECIEDYVRKGFDVEKSAGICQQLKVKYASATELLAEALVDHREHGGMGLPNNRPPVARPTQPQVARPQRPQQLQPKNVNPNQQLAPKAPAPVGGMGLVDQVEELVTPFHEHENSLSPDNFNGDQQVEIELGGDIGNEIDVNQEGSEVTLTLPMEAVQALDTALDAVLGPVDEDNNGLEEDNDDSTTFVEDDNDSETEDGDDNTSFVEDDNDNGFESEDNSSDENSENKESEVNSTENNEQENDVEAERLASFMRKGKLNRVGESNLDLSGVVAALKKQAGEVEPKVESAQDVVKDYTAGDGSVQGGEEKFNADSPDVPRNVATIGEEESDRNPQDKPLPKVPKGSGSEGNLEGEENYKAENGVSMSGQNGAGVSQANSKKKPAKLADKKVTVTPPQDVVKDYSANKDHSKSGVPRVPFEKSKDSVKIPEGGDAALIQEEKSSIGSVPKADKNAPEIPSEGKLLSKEKNEKNKPELVDKVKGFVAASDEKSQAVLTEAFKIAGRMVETKRIEASELQQKVTELSRYNLSTLKDIEKELFRTANKGLITEPGGVEQPVPIISLAANERSQTDDVAKALQSFSTLYRQNEIASELTDANLRKLYNK